MEPELLENIENLLQSGDIDNIALALQIAKGLDCLSPLLEPRKELAKLLKPALGEDGYNCLEALAGWQVEMDLDAEEFCGNDVTYNMPYYLEDLIDDIRALPFLKIADASDKNRTTLPQNWSYLKSLKVLKLNNNQLTALPEFIKDFPQLEELYIAGNQLEELPDWLPKLPNLKVLDISKNPLNRDFEGYFEAFFKLECLLVEDLGCYEIPNNIIENNKGIYVTILAENGSLIGVHGPQYYKSRVSRKSYEEEYYAYCNCAGCRTSYLFNEMEKDDCDWSNDGFEKADLIEDSYYTNIKNARKKRKDYLQKNKKRA